MAKPLPPFIESLVDLLSPLGELRVKRMFGGFGFYLNEVFFAIADGNRFFLKTDEQTRPQFEAKGLAPFTYTTSDGSRSTMGYHEAPEEALDSAIRMKAWATLALQAAHRAQAAKKAPARKKR
jgi:DNA transformation protein